MWFTATNTNFYLSISNTDSGWGDNYTPTVDEIKAYFMGWKMWQGDSNDSNIPYTSGTKRWRSLTSGDEPSVLPTTQAPNYTPYQLVYQLATPTVEPIVSEGMLTFNEGDNQIEVGTGMVVRERANPILHNNTHYLLNHELYPASLFKYANKKIIKLYRDNQPDPRWYTVDDNYAHGNERASIIVDLYDPSAAYSVTYLMLDKSPIVPFTGSYAANEKAMLQELTDVVQQNATAVSVLMNKKADKDKPIVWIEPTLINGAAVYPDTAFRRPSYSRTADGLVIMSGLIRITSSGSSAFILPVGYRPSKMLIFSCTIGGGDVLEVRVDKTGALIPMGAVDWVSLEGIRFIAEQ